MSGVAAASAAANQPALKGTEVTATPSACDTVSTYSPHFTGTAISVVPSSATSPSATLSRRVTGSHIQLP